MFRPLTCSYRRSPRRGTAILLTVFSLITLLMVAGLTYVMYAAKEKAIAERYKEAASGSPSLVMPDSSAIVNQFFGKLIYDDGDAGTALLNAMRGHSIARSMYGWKGTGTTSVIDTPWNGVGTFHEDAGTYNPTLTGLDRARFVNHTLTMLGATPFLIDPEYMGARPIAGSISPFIPAGSPGARNYVSKAAGYTYPDLKNFWLAQRDPATGEVLIPSFHRDWVFRHTGQAAGESSFHPLNPNWGTNTARGAPQADAALRTLRPRYVDHPLFPKVPPNANGTYTGDVQNLPGDVGVQKNDSIWMNIGLPTFTLTDGTGRVVQPLVAPLILALDANFDLSRHGNQLGGTAHKSHGGYGPWEVNPMPPLALPLQTMSSDTDRLALLQNRNPSTTGSLPRPRYNQHPNSSPPHPPLPAYAPVAWNNNAVTFTLPANGSITGLPVFGGYQSTNDDYTGHPVGYNPNDYQARSDTNTNSPVFPYSDLKRLGYRYAYTPDWHMRAFTTRAAQDTFRGNQTTFPFLSAPSASIASNYRLDPAHNRRGLFSPRFNHLDRPASTPNFLSGTLALGGGGGGANKPGMIASTPYPSPTAVGPTGDFESANVWVNKLARLGSVNVNRPLADYRAATNPTGPLSNSNSNTTTADADRRALARDIFVRLVAATGASGQIDPATGNITLPTAPPTVATKPQYDALRYLAQLAVNIVDHIDNDDISTIFVWNPANAANPALSFNTDVTDPANRVVFGVEKPRLLISEMYSEITNDLGYDGTDTSAGSPDPTELCVKFWAELVNPTSTTTGILGNGEAPLNAYQIEIARANRVTGGPEDRASFLNDAANTTGRFNGTPDARFTLGSNGPTAVLPNNAKYPSPPSGNLPNDGFVLVRPPNSTKANQGEEYKPTSAKWTHKVESGNLTMALPSNAMGYKIPVPDQGLGADSPLTNAEFKRHVVLLRRLTNPYLAPNDPLTPSFNELLPVNPYITVDMMDYVPSFDAAHRLNKPVPMQAFDRATVAGGKLQRGFDPPTARFSVGKVQPLAGLSLANPAPASGAVRYNQYSLTSSMVLAQASTPPNPNDEKAPKNTFGRHNGLQDAGPTGGGSTIQTPPVTLSNNETIMTPFDWLIHMDRPLETQGDLFHVRDSKPHLLTKEFVRVGGTPPAFVYDDGLARWRYLQDGIARALEYLVVKSPDYRVAHGGRGSGKINVNAMTDRRIAQGLWDPQTSNKFTSTFVDNTIWGQWMNSRSLLVNKPWTDGTTMFPVPVPGSSMHDTNAAGDRPFLPFGAPAATNVAAGAFAYNFPANTGNGTDDTILRRAIPAPLAPPPTPPLPLLYNPDTTVAGAGPPSAGQTYLQSEPARKVMNNVTTVSHTFVVYLTIGYFELKPPTAPADVPGGWPTTSIAYPGKLGAEIYDKVPGDLREKYMGIVDMSNMALQASGNAHATERPFFTALDTTARAITPNTAQLSMAYKSHNPGTQTLTVAADGVEMTIKAVGSPAVGTDTLVVGYGVEQQIVTVNSVDGPGLVTVTSTQPWRTAWAGTCVSNVRPGYAGPRPTSDPFDYKNPKYAPVVPLVEVLRKPNT